MKITSRVFTLAVVKKWREYERRLYTKEELNTMVVDKMSIDVDKVDFSLYIMREGMAIPSQVSAPW